MSVCAKISLPVNRSGPTEGHTFASRFKPFDVASAFLPSVVAAGNVFEHVAAPSDDTLLATGPTTSGLFNAALYAFAEEMPLYIKPDDVYLHVLQRVAEHVNLNSQALKDKFTSSAEKQTIIVINDALRKGSPHSPWHEVFPLFRQALQAHIVGGEVPTVDFSETTPLDAACQTMALMDMLQTYFNFEVHTRCGIPEIALGGTARDWALLAVSVAALLERVDMGSWLEQLRPILAQFESVASGGAPDQQFWARMIRLHAASSGSGPCADGWITKLFPYVKKRDGSGVVQNAFLENDWQSRVPLHALPSSISKVPFVWDYFGTRFDMLFLAGTVGVKIDGDGRLATVSSFAIAYDSTALRAAIDGPCKSNYRVESSSSTVDLNY